MTTLSANILAVYGMSDHWIVRELPGGIHQPVHQDIVAPFLALQADARQAGFDMRIVSGYRDFQRQCRIWNTKASGQRPLLDSQGQPLVAEQLDDLAKVHAIMRWSALPGASRHHWGTDIDVYDAAAVAPDYQVSLIPAEVDKGGPFAPLHQWLDEQIEADRAYGFFRPYAQDTGGIAPERWHLSYAPLAGCFQQQFDPDQLRSLLEQQQPELLATILAHLPTLFQRYITVNPDCYPDGVLPERAKFDD